MGIVQNSCVTLMKGFDPLQMLTIVHEALYILNISANFGSWDTKTELVFNES